LYGLSSILGRFLNYLLVGLYTRALTPVENGVMSHLYAFSTFFMVLMSYRLESAFFRYGTAPEGREKAYQTGIFSLLATTAALLATALLAAGPLAGALDYAQHPEYVRWFALILAFDCLAELPFARLRLEQRAKRFVTGKLFNISLNIALNVFWLWYCPRAAAKGVEWVRYVWSPDVRVGYVFIANMMASAATLLFLLPQLRLRPANFDPALWRQMIGYSAPLILSQLAGLVNSVADRAMQKALLPGSANENLAQMGIYSNHYKLAMLITIFTQAYRYAAEPFFFRHANDDNAMETQAEATKWFTIVSATGMLGVLLFLDVAALFLGPKFRVGLHETVPVLLLGSVLLGVYYNFSVWYRLKDKTATGAWITVGGAALTVLLNIWWLPVYGVIGSAWATLICYAIMCWLAWQTGRPHYPVPYPLGRMFFYIGLALALYALRTAAPAVIPSVWALRGLSVLLFGLFGGIVYSLERQKVKL
jgi:O-antigen/teichoic acid export membrane protein